MAEVDIFFDDIDELRSRRARELSDLKNRFAQRDETDLFGINSKAVVVLAYAHWEGFYNECVNSYLSLLKALSKKFQDVPWMMLIGLIGKELQSLYDRNHSLSAKCDFVDELRRKLTSDLTGFDNSIVAARSNLDFARLSENFKILGFDISAFQRNRIKIEKELVGWRHSVAHGNNPDLSTADMAAHIDFTNNLILTMSDQFQNEMLIRSFS